MFFRLPCKEVHQYKPTPKPSNLAAELNLPQVQNLYERSYIGQNPQVYYRLTYKVHQPTNPPTRTTATYPKSDEKPTGTHSEFLRVKVQHLIQTNPPVDQTWAIPTQQTSQQPLQYQLGNDQCTVIPIEQIELTAIE